MPKKKSEIIDYNPDYIPAVNVIVGTDPGLSGRSTLIGKEISINLRQWPVFGLGPIWLTAKNYWCVVPNGLTNEEYIILQDALRSGTIVEGKRFIEPIERPSNVLEHWWSLIEKIGFEDKKTKNDFMLLLRRGSDRGYTAKEIAQFCLDKEKQRKNREKVIKLLVQIIKSHNSPVSLWEPPDEDQGLKKILLGPEGIISAELNNGTILSANDISPEVKPPKDFIKGTTAPDRALSEALD